MARDNDGTPGLFMALKNGHADTVKAYLEAIKNSSLSPKEKIELFLAKDKEGAPGLYWAFKNGNPDAVMVYVAFIISSFEELSPDEKSVNPLGLLVAAIPPTLVAVILFRFI